MTVMRDLFDQASAGGHALLKWLTLFGAPHAAVVLTLMLREANDPNNIWLPHRIALLALIAAAPLPLLLMEAEVASVLLHLALLIIAVASGGAGYLPRPWTIAGATLGATYSVFSWVVTLAVLCRRTTRAARLARVVLAVGALALPAQSSTLAVAGVQGSPSVEALAWAVSGVGLGLAAFLGGRAAVLGDGEDPRLARRLSVLAAADVAWAVAVWTRVGWVGHLGGGVDKLLWAVTISHATLWIMIASALVVILCCVTRGAFSRILSWVLSLEVVAPNASTFLASSPASVLLTPVAWTFFLTGTPLAAVLASSAFSSPTQEGSRLLRRLLLAEGAAGIVGSALLAVATYFESSRPQNVAALRCLMLLCGSVGGAVFALQAVAPLALATASAADEPLWRMTVAGLLAYWQVFVLFAAWGALSLASRAVQGELWGAVLGCLRHSYYAHDDAKSAAEAATASLSVGVLVAFLALPMDLASATLCEHHSPGACSPLALASSGAAALASATWLFSALGLVAWTRLRSPPALVAPAAWWRCLGAQQVWVVDLFEAAGTLAQVRPPPTR